jgi:ribose-phosphate pyrophosphokinase
MAHMTLANKQVKLISGRAHPKLAKAVAKSLGIKLSKVELDNFANGEISCQIEESVRGYDVFVIQSHAQNVNDSIIEQALIIDAAKRASAQSITAVCPWLGYTRQDRKSHGREPIASRFVIDLLAKAGADRIISVDLHSGQIQGFFDGPFDHLIAMPVFVGYLKEHFTKNLVIVSPDAGRVKLSERYASQLGCEIAIIHKHRSVTQRNVAEARYLIGEVEGKDCVVIDDIIDTGSTLGPAAELLMKKGAKSITGIATHGLFSGPALERIEKSAFAKIIVSDSVPQKHDLTKTKIEVLSIAPLISDAIAAVVEGWSVSAIFEGRNQY